MMFETSDMSFTDMVMLLTLGKGVDVVTFNEKSKKTLRQFYNQVHGRDVRIGIIEESFPDVTEEQLGCVLLIRYSTKILIQAEGHKLVEMRRVYEKSGKKYPPEESIKQYSISESRKIGESVKETAVRALKEELDFIVHPGQLWVRPLPDEILPIRKSRVYDGILVQEVVHWVDLSLPQRPWGKGPVIYDDGTWVHTEWLKAE